MDGARLNAIIVDDEPSAIRILENFAQKSNQVKVLHTFRHGLNVQRFLLENTVEVIFLDINMPELSGLELLKSLSHPPLIVLTTAYSEYAVESYEFSVADYLLKPIAFSRYIKAVHKCRRLLDQNAHASKYSKKITIEDAGKHYHFDKEDISHVQAYGNYLKIFTLNQRLVIKSSLKSFLENYTILKLIRVHKSYAVNANRVSEISYSNLKIGNHDIPIGRKYKKGFLSYMKEKHETPQK